MTKSVAGSQPSCLLLANAPCLYFTISNKRDLLTQTLNNPKPSFGWCAQAGKELDLPVYFGDAGSAAVLHSIGAHKASCCVVTLDSPGANYRTVWALHRHFPDVKVYVRAHDVNHGINLEKVCPSRLDVVQYILVHQFLQVGLP